MVARAGKERDACRCVGLVGFEVEVEADAEDGDEAGEMDI